MKAEDLGWMKDNYSGFFEILCHAILLDKVKITNGRIKVESWDD